MEDEKVKFDELNEKAEGLKADAERALKLETMKANTAKNVPSEEETVKRSYSFLNHIEGIASGKLDGVEKEVQEQDVSEERAIGRLTEAFVQIAVPGGAGAKAATMAAKALKAKRAGKYLNFKSKNVKKGTAKAKQLNDVSGKQRFAAVVAGGAAGETLVADVEKIGTYGDLFEGGPTELD